MEKYSLKARNGSQNSILSFFQKMCGRVIAGKYISKHYKNMYKRELFKSVRVRAEKYVSEVWKIETRTFELSIWFRKWIFLSATNICAEESFLSWSESDLKNKFQTYEKKRKNLRLKARFGWKIYIIYFFSQKLHDCATEGFFSRNNEKIAKLSLLKMVRVRSE